MGSWGLFRCYLGGGGGVKICFFKAAGQTELTEKRTFSYFLFFTMETVSSRGGRVFVCIILVIVKQPRLQTRTGRRGGGGRNLTGKVSYNCLKFFIYKRNFWFDTGFLLLKGTVSPVWKNKICTFCIVRYHCGGWSEEVNSRILFLSYMVYL
jgi:hypothetical protein